MKCWNNGVLMCIMSYQYSISPILHHAMFEMCRSDSVYVAPLYYRGAIDKSI
jgi:hypothetical protein